MGYSFKYDFSKEAERWRAAADYWDLSLAAKQKLEWMIFYHQVAHQNVSFTAQYFGISRKTLHKWLNRFDPTRIQSLEEESRRPDHLRQWEVTHTQEQHIKQLRQQFLQYGKQKLKLKYQQQYHQVISTWKIERVIRKHRLYPDPKAHFKLLSKKRKSRQKVRIHTLDTSQYPAGTLWHIDSIVTWWYDQYRTIVTALEDRTKLGFARVYSNHSSRSATDFLNRRIYLS